MKIELKINIFYWFIVLGLSFLAQYLGFGEQPVLFMYMYLGGAAIICLALAITSIYATRSIQPVIAIIVFYLIFVVTSLFIPLILDKLFNLDFYICLEVVAFLACLLGTNFTASFRRN